MRFGLLCLNLPDTKRERFVSEYGLPESDADLLVDERSIAESFEEAVQQGGNPKNICNWILTVFLATLMNMEKSLQNFR